MSIAEPVIAASGVFARSAFAEPFAIGIRPIADPAQWLAPDERLGACLAEKNGLITARKDAVFAARADTSAVQAEVLSALADHLPRAFPAAYERRADAVIVSATGDAVPVGPDHDDTPLLRASLLVSDDLVLMRKDNDGWRLVAASLCFPSYWRLQDKFDRPLPAIHGPVPGFGPGTRKAILIERMFDNLKPGLIVARSNLSFHDNPDLHRPQPHQSNLLDEDAGLSELARTFLRSEDQTLLKLPTSGDLLFTIRVATDPIAKITKRPEMARSLAGHLRALDFEQRSYKGLERDRDRFAAWLDQIAVDAG